MYIMTKNKKYYCSSMTAVLICSLLCFTFTEIRIRQIDVCLKHAAVKNFTYFMDYDLYIKFGLFQKSSAKCKQLPRSEANLQCYRLYKRQ